MNERNGFISLNTGQHIPQIGFGTWKLDNNHHTEDIILTAIRTGFRLIDTAAVYGNEESVGKAIRASQVPREEFTIITKLWNTSLGKQFTADAFDKSVRRLGLNEIDIYLIHWPANELWKESWLVMEELFDKKQVRGIGVSNFNVDHLRQLESFGSIVPVVNQIELHPFNYRRQKEILEYCQKRGIAVIAYSPLAQLVWSNNDTLQRFARFYHKSPSQILLRWSIQHGAIPIPKASSKTHIQENSNVWDFQLSRAEMTALNKLSF